MADLVKAAQAVLDRWDSPQWEWAKQGPTADLMAELRAALAQAEPVQGPFALPCPTPKACREHCCSGHCIPRATSPQQAKPVQRKPLTEEEIMDAFHAARNAKLGASQDNSKHRLSVVEIARAVERAHGIGEESGDGR